MGADTDHTIEALVAVFGNVDAYGTRLLRGAFANSLREWERRGDPIPFMWSHRHGDPMAYLGGVERAWETEAGLQVRARINTQASAEATRVYELLRDRLVTEFSFAFEIIRYEEARTPEGKAELDDWGLEVWNLLEVKLLECGPCFKGANDQTQLIDVRTADSRTLWAARQLVDSERLIARLRLRGGSTR